MDELLGLLTIADTREKIAALMVWVDVHLPKQNARDLSGFVLRMLSDDVPAQVSKPVMIHFVTSLQRVNYNEAIVDVANQTLQAIKSSVVNLDEADYILRDMLFRYFVDCGQFSDAATTLAMVNVESVSRPFSDAEKVDIYIKCAEAYLEDEMAVEAEVFMNKASPFINAVSEWVLQLRYKVTFARVLDANRKFSEASMRYYELSLSDNDKLVEEELLELLAKAITCVILSKASSQRSRVLGLIAKDQRLSALEHHPKYAIHASIVQKMSKDHIVKMEEAKSLESHLADHQKALTADGSTVLQKAVIEHNMIATSKIYCNIRFAELSSILGIPEKRAEKVVATMVAENRLKASIDQIERLVIFESAVNHSAQLDAHIGFICDEITSFVDVAQECFPAVC